MWRLSISEIDSSVSSLRKNICRIASMFIITRAVSTPRDFERRERGSMFCETRCFSLDIRLFTYIFSCSLSRSSRRLLSILVSSLTFLHVFLDSLYAFYFLIFSVALSLSFRLFSLKTLSPRTWSIKISPCWQSFSSAGIVARRQMMKQRINSEV